MLRRKLSTAIILLLLTCPVTAWGGGEEFVFKSLSPEAVVTISPNGDLYFSEDGASRAVPVLAASGKICEIYGHWWKTTSIQASSWDDRLSAEENMENGIARERICKICQKKQVWKEEWEDR